MATALLISPHLDDAVFSAGGTMALLAGRGWQVIMATVFTRSVHPAYGFALSCQRDKGLADDVDYMALRRAEDAAAAALIGAQALWLDLPEAPHRGYQSAAALFGDYHPNDAIEIELAAALRGAIADTAPDLVLGPAALGAHVDHRRVLDALRAAVDDRATALWRDTPYVIRQPDAASGNAFLGGLEEVRLPIGDVLEVKLAAAAAYGSQLGFQFGGATGLHDALRQLATREGDGVAAERLYATPGAMRMLRA